MSKERVVGYNNKVIQTTSNVKLGVNNDVDTDTKEWGCALRTVVLQKLTRQTVIHLTPSQGTAKKEPATTPAPATMSHDMNKALIVIGGFF